MDKAATSLSLRLQRLFVDREFIMRSQGQVRFVRVSAKFQKTGAAIIAALSLVWFATMAVALVTEWSQRRDAAALYAREAKITTAESRVAAYRDGVDKVADDLERRQQFIESMVESHLGELPEVGAVSGVQDSSAEAERTIEKVSAVVPGAAGLARMEARQLAFVEGLTRLADRRAEAAADAMRKLGLDPRRVRPAADVSAMGGPFEALSTGEAEIDPRFERLGASLARMSALERSLEGIPNYLPARLEMISSGFGYRRDPFNGASAMHSGLDFRGPTGTPIHAAANGKVVFAGHKGGYGKTIEIRHGNGVMTRYAHMSGYRAKVGDAVEAGDVIGLIGSTGRSTGPHLHFEVRINNRAVNPRTMLEKSASILGATRVYETKQDNGRSASDEA